MIACVFPGQGSQRPGMGRELAEKYPASAGVFDSVGKTLGMDLRALCWNTDEETLRRTENAQIALYTASMAAYVAWQTTTNPENYERLAAFAGHSVGEYSALTAAGILSLEDGAKLVRTRGELMAKAGLATPGTMAAILGLGRLQLEEACDEVGGLVVVANDNCPGQLVISGEVEAVRLAGEAAVRRGAKRVLPLNVSGAFHSPLMQQASIELGEALKGVTFGESHFKVYSNVTSQPIATGAEWPLLLEKQLWSPVRWTESVEHMIRDGVMHFVECGPGDVLSGLLRRIDKTKTSQAVGDGFNMNPL